MIKFVSDLRTGRWFSSTNKTNLHYITELLLKVTSNTIKQRKTYFSMSLKILAFVVSMMLLKNRNNCKDKNMFNSAICFPATVILR